MGVAVHIQTASGLLRAPCVVWKSVVRVDGHHRQKDRTDGGFHLRGLLRPHDALAGGSRRVATPSSEVCVGVPAAGCGGLVWGTGRGSERAVAQGTGSRRPSHLSPSTAQSRLALGPQEGSRVQRPPERPVMKPRPSSSGHLPWKSPPATQHRCTPSTA
ncbi:hypothetical protein CB1_000357020 [Camelus ferus]|nr:hypothetical protein CB1_000357020 [Camelus ferus]